MKNNKELTAMKLYTEEQVIEMTKAACTAGNNNDAFIFWEVYKNITPIELPSDEEIGKEASVRHYGTNFKHVFASGAEWMRDKIQGGNK
jgi:hypothetical protein